MAEQWRLWRMKTIFAVLALVSLLHAQDIAPFPKAHVQSVWVQSIWADGKHNGFPGIARVGDFYYVTFRSGEGHGSEKSDIVVIRAAAKDLSKWEKVVSFTRDHDCRDPLVFDNKGKVQLVFHSRRTFTRSRRTV
jgi:hypothetical protein